MARIIRFTVILLVVLAGLGHAQCSSNYTVGCQGSTVCFLATSTSTAPVIPYNPGRKYLLIQSQSTTLPVYFAIGASTATNPLTAQVNVNTIFLPPQSPVPSNYEINALQNPNSIKVPTGAIAIIAPTSNVYVCMLEHNG
jgi:hypothetical protein